MHLGKLHRLCILCSGNRVLSRHLNLVVVKTNSTISLFMKLNSFEIAQLSNYKVGTYSTLIKVVLKYGSEEKGSSFCKCSVLQGFIMSKKTREVAF